ncbi:MAG: NADH-quinone oxidoreductase subunit A [bacterium]
MSISPEYREFVEAGAMLVAAILFAVAALALPVLLGPRRSHGRVKDTPYECGMPAIGERARFSVKFYIVAMLFILFDVEVVFLIGWAAMYRDLIRPVEQGGIGWPMLTGALAFLLILEVGHLYAWKKGALNWSPARAGKPQEGMS